MKVEVTSTPNPIKSSTARDHCLQTPQRNDTDNNVTKIAVPGLNSRANKCICTTSDHLHEVLCMDRMDFGIIHKRTQRKIEKKKPEEEEPELSRYPKKKKGGGAGRERESQQQDTKDKVAVASRSISLTCHA